MSKQEKNDIKMMKNDIEKMKNNIKMMKNDIEKMKKKMKKMKKKIKKNDICKPHDHKSYYSALLNVANNLTYKHYGHKH